MYTAASPDPDPNHRGGGQLPNANECNSMLTSITRIMSNWNIAISIIQSELQTLTTSCQKS